MAPGVSILEVDGLRCAVERKAIRKMYLRLGPEGVRLSVPRRIGDEDLRAFVRANRSWIEKKLAQRQETYAPQLLSGEGVWVWGRPCLLTVEEGAPAVSLRGDTLCLTAPADRDAAVRQTLLESWYRQQLAQALPAVTAEREAATGLHAKKLQLRNMKTRWGSCTPASASIRLSTQLARREPECLRYVLTHELAHLRQRGHGPGFYALLEEFYPSWRAVRQALRQDLPPLPQGFWEKETGKR